MKILYVASECLPYASTGGLADVLGSLPKAVANALGKGNDVRVVIPMYTQVRDKFGDSLECVLETTVWLGWRNQYCGVWKTTADGVTYYFIDNLYYFDRDRLYGSYDDGERFAFFSKAVMEMMNMTGFYPDVLHANDWQSALTVIFMKKKYGHIAEFKNMKAVFTIHNIDYQGVFDMKILGDIFELPSWERETVEFNGAINLLKGAIVCADKVTTVSESYSKEILTEQYSAGLHKILRQADEEGRLVGIVNGIDIDYYNPKTDPDIIKNYSAADLSAKKDNKAELQRICGLDVNPSVPVICMVSRLAGHKGFDIVREAIEDIINTTDIEFVLLGTGEEDLENFFKDLAARHPGRVCAWLEYNKPVSKKFYAGADLFLMPSKSEPCGLAQMIASRYATVPVVRACGGLNDTIHPFDEEKGTGNGFTFTDYSAEGLKNAVYNALRTYSDSSKWDKVQKNAVSVDFSWKVSAKKYIAIYNDLV